MAKVIKNDDRTGAPDYVQPKTGCVQVRIYPELADVSDADLPWAMPDDMGPAGTANNVGVHAPPEVGAFVRVRIEDAYMRRIFYTSSPMGTGLYPYEAASAKLSNVAGLQSYDYPEPRLIALPDGTVIFWNTQNGDMGVRHKSGSYIFLAANGAGTVSTVGRLSLIANGQVMGDLLKQLITAVENITTFGPPPQHVVSPASKVVLDALKVAFNQLISP